MFKKTSALLFLLIASLHAEEVDLLAALNQDTAANSPSFAYQTGPLVRDGADIFISPEYLFWGVNQQGLCFAISGVSGSPATQGEIKSIPTKWSSGFRVGLGAFLPHDNWETSFTYTWIKSNQIEEAQDGYSPLWNIGNLIGSQSSSFHPASTTASFKQTFQNLDIALSKRLMIGNSLILSPFAGIRGTYNDQHYHVSYLDIPPIGPLASLSDLSMKMNQYYWAVGFIGGGNSSWMITKNFGIFGDFLLGALSSHFSINRKDFLNSEANLANINSAFYTMTVVFDFQLGLKADFWPSKSRYHLGFELGYEQMLYLDQNQYIQLLSANTSKGDLSFNGLTFKMRFDF